jgi:hypothetical protein
VVNALHLALNCASPTSRVHARGIRHFGVLSAS